MIPTSELSKGALINSPTGLKNNSLTLSMVESWDEEFIILKGDRKVKRVECEGIELTDEWLGKFGFSCDNQYKTWCNGLSCFEVIPEFVHQLQGSYLKFTGEQLEVVINR